MEYLPVNMRLREREHRLSVDFFRPSLSMISLFFLSPYPSSSPTVPTILLQSFEEKSQEEVPVSTGDNEYRSEGNPMNEMAHSFRGEEFAVLLHGFDLATAMRLAEDCRSQLAQLDTRECGYSFVVTASFGVSSTAQSGYDLSRLLSHADQMLYRTKNEGRNRVCGYTAETAVDYKSPKRSPTLSVVGG